MKSPPVNEYKLPSASAKFSDLFALALTYLSPSSSGWHLWVRVRLSREVVGYCVGSQVAMAGHEPVLWTFLR